MIKTSLKPIKIYLKNVSKEVVCSYTIKKFFLKDLKQKLIDFYHDVDNLTLVMINDQFGTPNEIAAGFSELTLDKYITQAKKFKLFVSLLIIILILLLVVLFIILKEYGNNVTITD